MTREIEFRGKKVDNGEWVYGSYLQRYNHSLDDEWLEHYIVNDLGYNYEILPETVGQYTGLKDKNGNKIFEGDVVIQKFEKHMEQEFDGECHVIYGFYRGTVKILPSKGTVISPCYTEFDEDLTSIYYYQKPRTQYGVKIVGYRCEVIGNIHDKEV